MFSILGGKLSTYRLMAEKTVDAVVEEFGIKARCKTADIPLDGQDELSGYPLSKRLKDIDNIVCECELVDRSQVENAINSLGIQYIGDIQHRTRLGMGPCQGGFCTYRALGIMQETGRLTPTSRSRSSKNSSSGGSGESDPRCGEISSEKAARGEHLPGHSEHGAAGVSAYEYDAVAIGGGVSGIMASLTLASKGFKTALVSRGDPVCCLSTGCIDVFSHSDEPLSGIRALLPDHPYSLVGEKGIVDALSFFSEIMEEAGLPYEGDPGRNRKILTPIGSTKCTCLVPRTMAHADMPTNEYLHVISFQGIKDFFPGYITSRHRNSTYSVYDAGVPTTLGIAARFDDASFLDAFINWLRGLEIPHDRVALPAVLGTTILHGRGKSHRQSAGRCSRSPRAPSIPG